MANRDLWERLLKASQRHREVRWRKVKGHSKTAGPHKGGNDRADELAVAAKRQAEGDPSTGGCLHPEEREAPSIAKEARDHEGARASNRREEDERLLQMDVVVGLPACCGDAALGGRGRDTCREGYRDKPFL